MKNIISFFAFLFVSQINAQFKITIESPSNFTSKDAILYTINGSKDIIFSNSIKIGSTWTFKYPQEYLGMMKIYFPETNNSFSFISENKDINIKLNTKASKISDVIYLDESNKLMEKVQDFQKKNEYIFPALIQIKEYYKDNSDFGSALNKEIERLSTKIDIDLEKNPFVSYYHTNYNKFLVEQSGLKPPSNEEITNFLLSSNSMLESSSLLRPILVNFLNSGSPSDAGASIDTLLNKVGETTPRGQTILSEFIDIFDVYSMSALKEKYLNQAKNLKCTINERLSSTLKANKNVEMGAMFPNYTFKSVVNTKAKNLYEIKANKKIVVFWSSTCSHCEAELPKILEKYNTLKSLNIEVVGLSLDTDTSSYELKIKSLPWINTSELRGWNSSYADTYNIHATPTYFVLDSDNKIIAKPEHVNDVFQFLNLK